MKKSKALSFSLAAVSVCSLGAGIASFAANNTAEVKETSMQNSFICLTVEGDSQQGEYLRYRLDTTGGQTASKDDDNTHLTYSNFFSGITTVNIDGKNYIYGRGTDVSEPAFNAANRCHTSSQSFGDVVIEQKLSFAEGTTPGSEDMLRISYRVVSAKSSEKVGVRILIDPMLGDDDAASLSAGKTEIKNEAVFAADIPTEWSAVQTSKPSVSAYGKLSGVSVLPDSLTLSNWNSAYDTLWDYKPDINKVITDAGVSVQWEPVSEAVGKEFTTFYGIKNAVNTGSSNEATVNSPHTGSSFPKKSAALCAVSVLTAAGCIALRRKENRNED